MSGKVDMRAIFKERSIESWIEEYEVSHQNSLNRGFHLVGIPLIALSIPLFLVAIFVPRFWRLAAAMFLLGWTCQIAGHALEGRPPEFLKDWRFLFVGLRWWISRALPGRAQ